MDEPGDQAVIGNGGSPHHHPTYRLSAGIGNDDQSLEETISFRVIDSSGSPVYSPTDVYVLGVSNGYLPALVDTSNPQANKAQLKCQKAVASAARKLSGEVYQRLAQCVDAALAHKQLGASHKPVLKKCNLNGSDPASLVSKLNSAKEKSISSLAKKCDFSGSNPYSENMVRNI